MIKKIKNLLKVVLVLVIASLIMPINAISHTLDKTEMPEKHQSSQAEEPGGHVLNCLGPHGHHRFLDEFTCPLGGEKFKSLVMGTHSTFGRHLDWEPVSYLEFPSPLPVCPSNGFIMAKDEYTDAELEKIGAIIESPEYKEIYGERHASYYLYARWNRMLKEKSDDEWWYLLEATWEADQCKDSKKYQLYARETIKAAKLALENHETKDHLYWVFNIIIPNLHRRVGDFDSAQAWLDAFGDQLPEDEKSKEFYELAFKLLRQAVAEQDTSKIPIKDPKDVKK